MKSISIYLSFVLFNFMKRYFHIIDYFYSALFTSKKSWKLLSEKSNNKHLLPYVMVNAPRWNTHALIGLLGPIKIEKNIQVNTNQMDSTCKFWSLTIYQGPNKKSVFSTSSIYKNNNPMLIQLPSEKYMISLRVYKEHYPFMFPNVLIDQKINYCKRIISNKVNYLPKNIMNKSSSFYCALHHYLLKHLENQKASQLRLDLKSEYLPVGNPDTIFYFGYLKANCTFTINRNTTYLDNVLVFLTCYNKSSFPIFSTEITSHRFIQKYGIEGSYLIRIIPLSRKINKGTPILTINV